MELSCEEPRQNKSAPRGAEVPVRGRTKEGIKEAPRRKAGTGCVRGLAKKSVVILALVAEKMFKIRSSKPGESKNQRKVSSMSRETGWLTA